MPALALKDEMVLNVDGILSVDPALALRKRAERFVSSRQWTTESIFYGDQPEPEFSEDKPMWGMCFCLGLDHVPDHVQKTQEDWFGDVTAIIEFVQTVTLEWSCEFIVEFRLNSRLWYSETLGFIEDDPNNKIDLATIRSMLEHFVGQKRSWWRSFLRAITKAISR